MPKMSEFYVGVIEFFSILLPGAMLAAVLVMAGDAAQVGLPPLLASEAAQWVAFALAAYALGHFLFLAASPIDRLFYDPYRRRVWPRRDDHAYLFATELREAYFRRVTDGWRDCPMNTFAWAKALLRLKAPAAAADVERYEADSKFFRSLIVVLPLSGLVLAWIGAFQGHRLMLLALPVGLLLAWVSFLRYAERRYKSTEWAYRYVLTLFHGGGAAGEGS